MCIEMSGSEYMQKEENWEMITVGFQSLGQAEGWSKNKSIFFIIWFIFKKVGKETVLMQAKNVVINMQTQKLKVFESFLVDK